MTYIWYTNSIDNGNDAMFRQMDENNDTILESVENTMGWAHLECVSNDYIVIPANEEYSNTIIDVIHKSCKPVHVKTDARLFDYITDKITRMGIEPDVDIKVF